MGLRLGKDRRQPDAFGCRAEPDQVATVHVWEGAGGDPENVTRRLTLYRFHARDRRTVLN